jgi:hypothetical protein
MAKTIPFSVNNLEQAEALRATLAGHLHAGETVHLDFAEAGIVPASFMNVAVASLRTEFSVEVLNNRLVFYGMSNQHRFSLGKAIKFQKEVLAGE